MNKLFLMFISLFALVHPAVQEQWPAFLVSIEQCNEGDKNAFREYLTMLKQADILPFWQATVLHQAIQRGALQNPEKALQDFVHEYRADKESIESFMQQLATMRHSARALQLQANNGFTNENSVHNVWHRVKQDVIDPLCQPSFKSDYERAPFIVKAVACDVMREAIDTIDMVIKTVKMSTALSAESRMNFFASMIHDFHELFQNLGRDLTEYHYLNTMRSLSTSILAHKNERMFKKSREFSVQAAVMGSRTAFERHHPQTAEDLFMLIHQNSLMAVAMKAKNNLQGNQGNTIGSVLEVPEILIQAMQVIEDVSDSILNESGASHPQRIGIDYNPQAISIKYNMPLNNHSSTFQLAYDRVQEQCSISIQFLGQARSRWKEIATFIGGSAERSGLTLSEPINLDERAGIVSWGWRVNTAEDVICGKKYLAQCARISFGMSINWHDLLPLPTIISQAMSLIENSSDLIFAGAGATDLRRIAIESNERTLSIKYTINFPNYSTAFQLEYDRSTGQSFFTVQSKFDRVIGPLSTKASVADLGKWLADKVDIWSRVSQLNFYKKPNVDKNTGFVEWSWMVNNEQDVLVIKKKLAYIARSCFWHETNVILGIAAVGGVALSVLIGFGIRRLMDNL